MTFAHICLITLVTAQPGGGPVGVPTEPGQSNKLAPEQLEELKGVGVVEHLGDSLGEALHEPFEDVSGTSGPLSQWIGRGDKPVLLTFNYTDCPMLCSIQLQGLVRSLKGMSIRAGEDYSIVTLGLDPLESMEKTRETQAHYRELLGVEDGWFFLRGGSPEAVRKVADQVGFGYRRNEENGEYLHTATTMVLTPDARVSRYLYGVSATPKTAELSLVEASLGKLGSTLDKIVLYCFHYDPTKGSYSPIIFNIMKIGAALTVFVLGGLIAMLHIRGRQRTEKFA
jgi:protein SCO1